MLLGMFLVVFLFAGLGPASRCCHEGRDVFFCHGGWTAADAPESRAMAAEVAQAT